MTKYAISIGTETIEYFARWFCCRDFKNYMLPEIQPEVINRMCFPSFNGGMYESQQQKIVSDNICYRCSKYFGVETCGIYVVYSAGFWIG